MIGRDSAPLAVASLRKARCLGLIETHTALKERAGGNQNDWGLETELNRTQIHSVATGTAKPGGARVTRNLKKSGNEKTAQKTTVVKLTAAGTSAAATTAISGNACY